MWLRREDVQQVFRRPYLAHVGSAVSGCHSSGCCCCIVYFEARKELYSNLALPGLTRMFLFDIFLNSCLHMSQSIVQESCGECGCASYLLVAFECHPAVDRRKAKKVRNLSTLAIISLSPPQGKMGATWSWEAWEAEVVWSCPDCEAFGSVDTSGWTCLGMLGNCYSNAFFLSDVIWVMIKTLD